MFYHQIKRLAWLCLPVIFLCSFAWSNEATSSLPNDDFLSYRKRSLNIQERSHPHLLKWRFRDRSGTPRDKINGLEQNPVDENPFLSQELKANSKQLTFSGKSFLGNPRLTRTSRNLLNNYADWLKKHPMDKIELSSLPSPAQSLQSGKLTVIIQYLTKHGVNPEQITTIQILPKIKTGIKEKICITPIKMILSSNTGNNHG